MKKDTTPYMLLELPVATKEIGPDFSENINAAFTVVDQHDHSNEKGLNITPAGININSNLEFNNNDAVDVRSIRLQKQPSLLTTPDLTCIYVNGVDLYYNNASTAQIRITQNGAIAGTPGSIANLIAPANITYNSGTETFIFQSASNTPGSLDIGSINIREATSGANAITISSTAGLVNNYTLTMPASLPSTGKFLTVDGSGNIFANKDVDNIGIELVTNTMQIKDYGVTNIKLSPKNYTISSTLFFSATSAILVTSGRPVLLALVQDSASTASISRTLMTGSPSPSMSTSGYIGISKNGTTFIVQQTTRYTTTGDPNNPGDPSIEFIGTTNPFLGIDTSSTGSGAQRYTVINKNAGFSNYKLLMMEL